MNKGLLTFLGSFMILNSFGCFYIVWMDGYRCIASAFTNEFMIIGILCFILGVIIIGIDVYGRVENKNG